MIIFGKPVKEIHEPTESKEREDFWSKVWETMKCPKCSSHMKEGEVHSTEINQFILDGMEILNIDIWNRESDNEDCRVGSLTGHFLWCPNCRSNLPVPTVGTGPAWTNGNDDQVRTENNVPYCDHCDTKAVEGRWWERLDRVFLVEGDDHKMTDRELEQGYGNLCGSGFYCPTCDTTWRSV